MIRKGIRFDGRVCDKVADGVATKEFIFSFPSYGVIDGIFACPCVTYLIVVLWCPEFDKVKLSAKVCQIIVCGLSSIRIYIAFVMFSISDRVSLHW